MMKIMEIMTMSIRLQNKGDNKNIMVYNKWSEFYRFRKENKKRKIKKEKKYNG